MASTIDTEAVPPADQSPARLAMRTPQTAHDLEKLLRRRLVVLAILAALATGFHALFRRAMPDQLAYLSSLPAGRFMLAYEAAFGALGIAAAIILWRRRRWSIQALRAIEYCAVALYVVYIGGMQMTAWSGTRIPPDASGGYDSFVVRQFIDAMAVRWLALIVGFATLIPETWRRSAAIVGSLAGAAMAITVWMTFIDPVYSRPEWRVKTIFLMGFWMTVASTIAVFGSYKLSELREQVREALKLGQYRLREKLGAGGMGEVYRAEHVMLKQDVAIKLIRPERAGDPGSLRRFEREVKATSRLKHWNTVQIFDYGHTDDGTFYYVMEYLPGSTLDQIVKRGGPLSPGRAIHFLRQVCSALNEAHAIGLVHRDIKPANIIAGERGGVPDVAKLLDFGLVRHTDERPGADGITQDGALLGTPAYMSPEQVDARVVPDHRTDIYSLGAVGYFLLTGQPPFVRSKPMETMIAHARDPIPPLRSVRADVPADLEAVILRCLAKDANDRFASIAELDEALATCEANYTVAN